jgi:hypothetical protein
MPDMSRGGRVCEICGDKVKSPVTCKCGHKAYLCASCQADCPGALEQCVDCEEKNGPAWVEPGPDWRPSYNKGAN